MDLNHYGLGPLGAKALAIALRVGLVSDLLIIIVAMEWGEGKGPFFKITPLLIEPFFAF